MYHFQNSRTSTSKDEPLYLSKFTCSWVLPEPIRAIHGTELITEQLKSINGLDVDKMPDTVEQAYRFHKRRFAGTIVDTDVNLTFAFECNVSENGAIYPYNVFRDWTRLIYNPANGTQVKKRDYTGSVTIQIHEKDFRVVRKIFVPIIFPTAPLPAMDLDYQSDEIYTFELEFAAENIDDRVIDTI